MKNKILITGGAGFIGVNSADFFASNGWDVVVLDNLSRLGTQRNLAWLEDKHSITFLKVDICEANLMNKVLHEHKPEVVLHLAAQVAVTNSITSPRADFEINALGTLNVLEAIRLRSPNTFFINASTNKVYGKLEDVAIKEKNGRYEYEKLTSGVPETRHLDFHSPYGCSKGAADQYSIDYARVYGIKTVTLRQSCIYGPHQFGIEDQGWMAWFTIAALQEKEITVYGDGKQIRDVLQVYDLIAAYHAAIDNMDTISGEAINIGGGPDNTVSLLELLGYLEKSLDKKITPLWDDWRLGDQPVFVCDLSKAKKLLKWSPRCSVEEGTFELVNWVRRNAELFT